MCIPSEHCLCLPCFFSVERILEERYLQSLKITPKTPSEYKEKMGTASTSWRNTISPSYLALRSELETEAVVHRLFNIFYNLADTIRRVITCKERDLGLWVELEGQEMGKPEPFQEMAFRTVFPEACPENKKPPNFVNVQLRQSTAVKVLLLGRLFLALPVSWKIQRTHIDKMEHFSQNSLIMASMI